MQPSGTRPILAHAHHVRPTDPGQPTQLSIHLDQTPDGGVEVRTRGNLRPGDEDLVVPAVAEAIAAAFDRTVDEVLLRACRYIATRRLEHGR